MRIGILVDELVPGSAPKLIGWSIRKLKELGVEAEALVIIEKDHWQKHKEHYDFHLKNTKIKYLFPFFPKWAQRIDFKFPGMSFFSLHHIMSWFFAYRAVDKKEFDIIIAHCQYSGLAAANIKRYKKIPFLLLMWDPSTFTAKKIYKKRMGLEYFILYLGAKILDKMALKNCEAVITSGKFHHEYLNKITKKNLEILPTGCFVKESLPDFSMRKPMIITFDRWDIGNIPTIFLDILQSLNYKDVTLTLGGFWYPSYLKEEFTTEVKKRDLTKRVNILGPLNEDMIMKLCSEAMVHIHPIHEAFGMQSLEAAACGCPIIIPKGSGVADLFEEGIHGYFPEPGNFKQLIESVNKIFSDIDKTKSMSMNAWERAKNYTWENYAKNLLEICKKYTL